MERGIHSARMLTRFHAGHRRLDNSRRHRNRADRLRGEGGIITFPANVQSQTVCVSIINDTDGELTELDGFLFNRRRQYGRKSGAIREWPFLRPY